MGRWFPETTLMDWIVACLLALLLSVDWAEVLIP